MRTHAAYLSTLSITTALILAGVCQAQIKDRVEWKKRAVELQYGGVRFGKHSLDELPVGGEWRMGANNASNLLVEAPLLSGDTVVPTGSYRVKIRRADALQFGLLIEGAGYEVARDTSLLLPAEYRKLEKPCEKLTVAWRTEKDQQDPTNRDLRLEVAFGPHALDIPAKLLATTSLKVKGYTLDAYAVPAAVLESRMQAGRLTVIASLKQKGRPPKDAPEAFNLLLGEQRAMLLPAQVAPTDSYGFGEIQAPADDWTFQGEVKWADTQTEREFCTLDSATVNQDKRLEIAVEVGRRSASILIDPPTKPRRASG